jgi:hypothetical protein
MLSAYNMPVERLVEMLCAGGLAGSLTLLTAGSLGAAILFAFACATCVLVVTGSWALAQVLMVKARAFKARHEQRALPEPPDKGSLKS